MSLQRHLSILLSVDLLLIYPSIIHYRENRFNLLVISSSLVVIGYCFVHCFVLLKLIDCE